MIVQENRRLANVKTRKEVGLDFVIQGLEIMTPFGRNELKELEPFYPGEEEELRKELNRVEDLINFAKRSSALVNKLKEVFMEIKDPTKTLLKAEKSTLSVVELYEIKLLLLQMRAILEITRDHSLSSYSSHCLTDENMDKGGEIDDEINIPEEFILEDTEDLLDILDPRHDRLNTFYIYEEFSEELGKLRLEKRNLEILIRKEQKEIKEKLRKEYGLELTPKFDIVISKSHDNFETIKNIPELEMVAEDYRSVTFELKKTGRVFEYQNGIQDIELKIEEEEERIREVLSRELSKGKDRVLRNSIKIGKLEFTLAKALYAIKNDLVKPEIANDHIIEIEDGKNIQVESILREKGKDYTPISISLRDGVTVITGANMGGKTISLKLSGQVPVLTQYGFFVGAKKAKVGLSNFIQLLIGDSQSVERGLSSFGSEMEELKEILDHGQDRSLILIDEIASGTNPSEGTALTKSLVDYLIKKPYISLITTHFETVTDKADVVNMQVTGLSNVDFEKLSREIQHKNRRERINIISKYMDYRLRRVDEKGQVPKDALNIATMLGLDLEIIEGAKKYIK